MISQPTHRRNGLQRISQAPRIIFGLLMIALLVFALVIGTTGMAVGATEPPAQEPANADLVSATAEEPEVEPVAVVEETAEAAEAEPIPLESAPAAPAAPAKAAAASKTKPATQPKPAKAQQQQAAAASTQTQSGEGESAAEDSAPQAVAEPEVAALRWAVTNSEGVNQSDTSFEIQGPGGTDVNDDAQWTTGLAATVEDFTGQENYSGLDLDPAAGVFEVNRLVSDGDLTVTEDVAADQTYRVRPTEAPQGFESGDDAYWQPTTGAVEPPVVINTYVLSLPTESKVIANEQNGSQTVLEDSASLSVDPQSIALLAAPDGARGTGGYQTTADTSLPSGWRIKGPGQQTPEAAQFLTFGTEIVVDGSDTTLNATWTRPAAGGSDGWTIEYTVAPEKWGPNNVSAANRVPQPDRSLGGAVVFIRENQGLFNAYLCTYTSQDQYQRRFGSTTEITSNCEGPFNNVLTTSTDKLTMYLNIPLSKEFLGEPGCPPKFGSTAYLRSWTGNLNNMNLLNWIAPVPFDTEAVSTCVTTKNIVVKKRVLANPGTVNSNATVAANIGSNHTYTEGANFRLFENTGNEIGAPTNFFCTITSGGQCTITVTGVGPGGVNEGKQYWVVEEEATPETPAAKTYINPMLYVGSYTGPTDKRPIVGLTAAVTGSTNPMYMPMTANNASDGTQLTATEIVQSPKPSVADAGSFGAVANSLENPDLVPKCEAAELTIGLILDESASISGTQWTTYRNALVNGDDSILGLLKEAGAKTSILGFGTSASPWHHASASNPTVLPTNYASLIPSQNPGAGDGRTNWDAALSAYGSNASKYDLILFITDGAPNYVFGGNAVNGNNVTLRSLEAPIYAANVIKDAGARLVAVGVGNGAMGSQVAANLRAVSGEDANSDYYQGNWESLHSTLSTIINGATCNVPVTVSKTEIRANGDEVTNAIGWNFDANVTGQGTRIGAERQSTGSVGTTGWTVKFSEPSGQTAAIGIDEEEVVGWTLSDVVCTSGGQSLQITRTGDSISLAGITTATQAVHCVFTNTQAAPKAELTLIKNVINQFGGQSLVSDWTLSATGPTAGVTGVTGANAVTAAEVEPGAYTLAESGGPDGYEASAWSCKSGQVDVAVTASGVVTLADEDKVTCTITNSDRAGVVDWTKVDEDGNLLSGSEWILRGPAGPATVDVAITDCTSGDCAATEDKDNTPGKFRVPGLSWGSYELIESLAPVGYNQATTSVSFVIAPQVAGEQSLELSLDPVVNTRILGTVTWTKVDSADTTTLLGQSQWKLTGPSGDSSADVTVEDCIAASAAECTGPDKHPGAGQFNVVGLAWGDYVLTETKAPPGYNLSSADYPFSIGVGTGQTLDVVLTAIENSPVTPPTIPLTGGIGRDFYALFGFGILVLSAGTFVAMQQRSRRREV